MTRPPTLTDRQIQIIRENLDLFPADILKLPEFATLTSPGTRSGTTSAASRTPPLSTKKRTSSHA